MSQKSEKKAQAPEQEITPKNITPPAKEEVYEGKSTYTVDEFASAPDTVGAKSPDIVRAALRGKDRYTQEEAERIVKDFSKKEVK